jgi:signal transduction histidine kinase
MPAETTASRIWLPLALVLTAALALLAWLQFRWIGEVAIADRDRRQAAIRTAAEGFARESARELGEYLAEHRVPDAKPPSPELVQEAVQAVAERTLAAEAEQYLPRADYDVRLVDLANGKRLWQSREFEPARPPEFEGPLAPRFGRPGFRGGRVGSVRGGPEPGRTGFGGFRGGPASGPLGAVAVQVWLRSGTLDDAVERARQRNLAVSLGILALMAGAVALLAGATRRTQHLAEREMEFVASVSHELRTPLAVIRAAGDNLAAGVVTAPEQVRRYGEVVRDESRRLANMVEQTLRFASLTRGALERRPVQPARVVSLALKECQPLLEKAGFEVEMDVEERLPLILGDEQVLSHALRNLIENAIRHAGDGRWLRLEAEGVKGFVEFRVADRGPGVDPAEAPHLFDAFHRGRGAHDRQTPGSGLGLALVRRIAEAHQGTVSVLSRLEPGACFQLRIPVDTKGHAG